MGDPKKHTQVHTHIPIYMCTSSMYVHTDNQTGRQTDSESKTSHFYTTTLLLMCWSNMPTEQCKQYIHISMYVDRAAIAAAAAAAAAAADQT